MIARICRKLLRSGGGELSHGHAQNLMVVLNPVSRLHAMYEKGFDINWYCQVSIQGVRYFKQGSTKLTKLPLVSEYCLELQIWALSMQQACMLLCTSLTFTGSKLIKNWVLQTFAEVLWEIYG
jgi:hypothetical protein